MTIAAWWAYEVRRCGHQAVTLPALAALLGYTGVAAGSQDGGLLGRTLLTCALPAATALVCAAVVAREPMPELHLSMPTPYPRTVARRLAWVAALAAVTALAMVALLTATGEPLEPGPTLLELAGLGVLLGGAAVWATLRSGATAPAAGLVAAGVLGKLLIVDRVVPGAAGQAVPALLAGGWLTVSGLRALRPGGTSGIRLGRDGGAYAGTGET
ncbi:hypothetical protein ABZ397_23190 [Streptomyces sp. NPDC005876]|uniref:hypothetical protein n=1 Tax=Streptomyces sp. NPDC005876 TaxID=3157076 RepID=UPI003405DC44